MIRTLFFTTSLLLAISSAKAEWVLNNHRSEVTFVSTKAIDISEAHRFGELAGRIENNGKAVVTLSLASVDTGIQIRDERMQEMLFETDSYPLATIRTKLDKNMIKNMLPGAISLREFEFELDLHGHDITFTAEVTVSMIGETAISVVSRKPVIITAKDAGLDDGIEALRSVANLPSIGASVPVSFALVFEK